MPIILLNIIKILVRPIKYYRTDWLALKQIIYEIPSDVPSIVSILINKINKLKMCGVEWSNNHPLKAINTNDIVSYDRVVIIVIK